MTWWGEVLLLLLSGVLWLRGLSHRDEVFGLFCKFLAVLVLLVLLIAGRPLLLELPLLALALWLPSAVRFESET
jgi:hypothetical protein